MIVVKINQFDHAMNKYGSINNEVNPMEILIYTLNLIFLVTTIFFYVKHYIHEEINHFFLLDILQFKYNHFDCGQIANNRFVTGTL
jgi:hypothetical protein